MAGKSKKHVASQGHFIDTETVLADGPKGHMELKSSAFAPTDCKLVKQYMVLDHMAAHYRKLNRAKPAIDSSAPKGWTISQKVRDRVRRETFKQERSRSPQTARADIGRPSVALSEADRMQMISMMKGLTSDHVENVNAGTHTRMQRTRSMLDKSDMDLINRIVSDTKKSPSHEAWTSREPNTNRVRPPDVPATLRVTRTGSGASTPRDGDLLNTQAHLFTEEKPFMPRTLRTNRTSKLTEFKYYNPPKRRSANAAAAAAKTAEKPPQAVARTREEALRSQRVATPMTMDSTDLMNETLRSRDMMHLPTPSGVPPLNISLDADHLLWIKEHSKKAHRRDTHNDATHKRNSPTKGRTTPVIGTKTADRNDSSTEEEELRYLAFVTDVTNDVLDRGIFTNRALKKIFESHIEKRKNDLKVSKMREMLDDLRIDLGIPANDDSDDEGVGMRSTHSRLSHGGSDTHPHANGGYLAGRGRDVECNDERKEGRRQKRSGDERKPPLPMSRPTLSQGMHHQTDRSISKINETFHDITAADSSDLISVYTKDAEAKKMEITNIKDDVTEKHDELQINEIFNEKPVSNYETDIYSLEPCTDVANCETDVPALPEANDHCEITAIEKVTSIFNNNKDEKCDASLPDIEDYTDYLQKKDDETCENNEDDAAEVLPITDNDVSYEKNVEDFISTADNKDDTINNRNMNTQQKEEEEEEEEKEDKVMKLENEQETIVNNSGNVSDADSRETTPRDLVPKPAPRKYSKQYSNDTPRSLEQSSESLQISDIDDDDF